MSTPAANVVKIDWKQVCPWTILFQAFGLALHVRQIFVGVIAAGLIAGAQYFIQGAALPYANLKLDLSQQYFSQWPLAPLMDLMYPLNCASCNTESGLSVGLGVDQPVFVYQGLNWFGLGRCCFLLAWTLLVGGLAGGIMCRRAAFEFAREESVSLWQTTRFVLKRAVYYLSAPALPLCGVFAIGVAGLLAGWLARAMPISGVDPVVIWIIPLAFGILAACLSFAIFAGWPMMVAAVSINGGDGFDALSRGFGFVIDRWRYYAWCTLLLVLYGNVTIYILLTLIHWGDLLASESIFLGLGSRPHADAWTFTSAESPWRWPLSLLLTGYAYSFFWSGMTLTYLLLRKSLDNAELNDVYLDEATVDPDGLGSLVTRPPTQEPLTLLPIIDLPTG
jgi:hypothetical protein